MRKRGFFFVLIDDGRRRCRVEGPLLDDRSRTDGVVRAQQRGDRINCYTDADAEDMQEAVMLARALTGYEDEVTARPIG